MVQKKAGSLMLKIVNIREGKVKAIHEIEDISSSVSPNSFAKAMDELGLSLDTLRTSYRQSVPMV